MAHGTNTETNYDFFPEGTPQFGARPGYGNGAIAELSSFDTIAAEPTSATTEGGLRIITDDHLFTGTNGFRKITFYRGGSETDGQSAGDPGFAKMEYNLKGFVVGDDAATREFCEQLLNKGVILLQDAPDCTDTRILQHGCSCDPAVVKSVKYSSGNRISGGKKGYEITFAASCVIDYQGVVTFRTA